MHTTGSWCTRKIMEENEMEKLYRKVVAFIKDEEGLTTVEYAIAGGLVGAVVILAFVSLGNTVCTIINYIDSTLQSNSPAA